MTKNNPFHQWRKVARLLSCINNYFGTDKGTELTKTHGIAMATKKDLETYFRDYIGFAICEDFSIEWSDIKHVGPYYILAKILSWKLSQELRIDTIVAEQDVKEIFNRGMGTPWCLNHACLFDLKITKKVWTHRKHHVPASLPKVFTVIPPAKPSKSRLRSNSESKTTKTKTKAKANVFSGRRVFTGVQKQEKRTSSHGRLLFEDENVFYTRQRRTFTTVM